MAGGRRAAVSIQRYLRGEDVRFGRNYAGPYETEFAIDTSHGNNAAVHLLADTPSPVIHIDHRIDTVLIIDDHCRIPSPLGNGITELLLDEFALPAFGFLLKILSTPLSECFSKSFVHIAQFVRPVDYRHFFLIFSSPFIARIACDRSALPRFPERGTSALFFFVLLLRIHHFLIRHNFQIRLGFIIDDPEQVFVGTEDDVPSPFLGFISRNGKREHALLDEHRELRLPLLLAAAAGHLHVDLCFELGEGDTRQQQDAKHHIVRSHFGGLSMEFG